MPRVRQVTSKRQEVEKIRASVTEFLRTNGAAIFEGDSLDLAISIYKNEDLPLGLRVHALALALPFERPRLSAVAMMTKDVGAGANPEFGKLFAEFERRLSLYGPEKRVELIEALRSTPE